MAKAQSQAILNFVQTGAYPESDNIVAAKLDPASLPALRKGLGAARNNAEAQLQSISRDVAPDVDEWIRRAKELQADIEQSRTIAQEVVSQAAESTRLHERHIDATEKARLLREEAAFNSRLQDSLGQIRAAADQFRDAYALAHSGDVEASLHRLQDLEIVLEELVFFRNTNALELLRQRVEDLRGMLVEQANRLWNTAVSINGSTRRLTIRDRIEISGKGHGATMDDVVRICASLDLVQINALRLARDLQYDILMPLFAMHGPRGASDFTVPSIEMGADSLSVSNSSRNAAPTAILDRLESIIHFIDERFPKPICEILATAILPGVVSRLQSHELSRAVPTTLDKATEYQKLLERVSDFTKSLSSMGWSGCDDLAEWTAQAPKVWLASRREDSISAVRVLLTTKLRQTKTVERVETQTISRSDIIASTNQVGDEGEDDWDENWGDDEPQSPRHAVTQVQPVVEEENMDGWDEEDESKENTANGAVEKNNRDGQEEDDWGWGEQEQDQPVSSAPSSPVNARGSAAVPSTPKLNGAHNKSATKELTLRETYRVTGLPGELLTVINQLLLDARELSSGSATSLPIAPAANALYSVPTLILAAYRALAPTHYELLPGGLMFLYNDSTRLAEELQGLGEQLLSNDASAATRLKLPTDIDSLNSFARRAYGRAMDAQRTIVRDLIDNAQGFTDCTVQPFASACDDAVAATTAHVRALASEWQGILSRGALLQSLGSVLGAVLGKIILDIEEMSDIGDDESKQLRRYCEDIGKLSDLFIEGNAQGASATDEAGERRDSTVLYTHNWIKFQYLMEILESSLADIKYLWTETGLRQEFEADELVDLVEALFADNDHRRRAIAEIRK